MKDLIAELNQKDRAYRVSHRSRTSKTNYKNRKEKKLESTQELEVDNSDDDCDRKGVAYRLRDV